MAIGMGFEYFYGFVAVTPTVAAEPVPQHTHIFRSTPRPGT